MWKKNCESKTSIEKRKEGRKEDDGTGEEAEDKVRRSSRKKRRVKVEEDDRWR